MQANRAAPATDRRRYGVDPAVIVAIWGLETNYGGFTGGFSVIEALATLAADGRRDGFFRTELISALRILDAGDIALPRMTGSYAGAMGQPQFMPSSYLDYAVSFDGTGRRDIWDNRNDALASIANYLARSGWRAGEPWGQPVRVPAGFTSAPTAATTAARSPPGRSSASPGRTAPPAPHRTRRRRGHAGRARRRGLHDLRQFRHHPPVQSLRPLRALRGVAGQPDYLGQHRVLSADPAS